MNVFENIREQVASNLSGWVKISDPKSIWTIESFEKVNYNEKVIKPHCLKCVLANQCWFKYEDNKKPEEFDYSKYSLFEIPLAKRGLYHPNCHDKKIPIPSPKISDIAIFDLERRMDFLFEDKRGWLSSWGYDESDKVEVFHIIESLSKEAYCKADYKNNPPSDKSKEKYGYRIRVRLPLPGKREKLGKVYMITSSYIVYPDGKLKNNTPIGGKSK